MDREDQPLCFVKGISLTLAVPLNNIYLL